MRGQDSKSEVCVRSQKLKSRPGGDANEPFSHKNNIYYRIQFTSAIPILTLFLFSFYSNRYSISSASISLQSYHRSGWVAPNCYTQYSTLLKAVEVVGLRTELRRPEVGWLNPPNPSENLILGPAYKGVNPAWTGGGSGPPKNCT